MPRNQELQRDTAMTVRQATTGGFADEPSARE